MPKKAMYSSVWFDTFATAVPNAKIATEVEGVVSVCPKREFPRLLEIGCGTGRISGPLASFGYQVVGLDVNVEALRTAQRRAPGPRYVALDQRHVGSMRWTFDAVLILWNSMGFSTRHNDIETLRGVAQVLRPGGKAVLDLYHPDWLRENESPGEPDSEGLAIRRWVKDGRCFHEIRYPDGSVDDIQFNVYTPDELRTVTRTAGLEATAEMVWWDPELDPSRDFARYQLECTRR